MKTRSNYRLSTRNSPSTSRHRRVAKAIAMQFITISTYVKEKKDGVRKMSVAKTIAKKPNDLRTLVAERDKCVLKLSSNLYTHATNVHTHTSTHA